MVLRPMIGGWLSVACLLLATAPPRFHTNQAEAKKPENLKARSLQKQVREFAKDALDDDDQLEKLFTMGDEAIPALIRLLHDPEEDVRAGAARALAYDGDRSGLEVLRTAIQSERDPKTKAAMSCFLAGALVQTRSSSDLDFLRTSVETVQLNKDDSETAFVAFCSALAMGMRGGNDSLTTMREVAKVESMDVEEINKAIQWLESNASKNKKPTSPASRDEEIIKHTVLDDTFFAEERANTSIDTMTFNQQRNRALVSLEVYENPRSARGYHLVLAKVSGVWKVVGIWIGWVA